MYELLIENLISIILSLISILKDDKDLINFHLRSCIYALSLFTAIILTYQIIKSRNRKQNIVYQPVIKIESSSKILV